MKRNTSFSLLERCELKYHVPLELVPAICDFIAPYIEKDPFSKSSEDGYYQVNSLYLDSPNLTFFQMKENELPDRMNMRVRAYGPNPNKGPFFLEIKRKKGDRILKYRGAWGKTLPSEDWIIPDELKNSKELENLNRFISTCYQYQTSPKLITNYKRLAFFGLYEEYSRVTFDIDLKHFPENNFSFDADQFYASDSENVFYENCNCILELKAPIMQIPMWMRDLVVHFNLKRSGFSKYGTAVQETLLRKTPLGRIYETF